MKFTKIIAAFAIASLVLVSCKKEEDKNLANIKPLNTAVKEHKAIAAENVQTASFEIEGMTCAMGCAKTIEKELSNLDGVEKATVDFDKKTATVVFDKTVQNQDSFTKVVEATGDGKTYKVLNTKS
ncbi:MULTISPECIES: heavy-metal-associated domain-containing protein [unclassified Flavobacterium]|uniref:heavy-metal-associated domain-containing protein n=1 Tax=unclassified Flavobacterium TaxID=196869 RepID=UPI0012A7884F|nr:MULTISPECIES: heavy metal-associated domain-containing protein [unclassified Flavobacterium]MBF4484705.1 heavy-metal-associated domain-containing protein [Flavobacterium sp. CSZ]QGK75743.1 heavy-metal-associated domain-containing protein [Flavobacterium sp. SLB02]